MKSCPSSSSRMHPMLMCTWVIIRASPTWWTKCDSSPVNEAVNG